MTRVVLNPNFSIKDVLDSAKGKFTCLKCGVEFEKTGLRLPNGKHGAACPKCGATYHIKS